MTAKPKRRRRWISIAAIGIVLLAVLWTGYWYATDSFVTSAIARVTASLAAKGRTVGCSSDASGGFPLGLNFDCADPKYADGAAGTSAAFTHLTAYAPLYWPGSVASTIAGPLVLDIPASEIALQAEWTKGEANVEAGLGGLKGGTFYFDDLAVTRNGESRLPFVHFSADSAEGGAGPAGSGAYRITATASGLVIKPVGSPLLPAIDGIVNVSALGFGDSLGTDPKARVAAWLAAGGKLQVDEFTVVSGETSATAIGTLSIAADGLVSGDLIVRLVGLDHLPDLFTGMKPKSRAKITEAVAAITMFTKPVDGEPEARDAPVTIRDGAISVGVIPVGKIPPLVF